MKATRLLAGCVGAAIALASVLGCERSATETEAAGAASASTETQASSPDGTLRAVIADPDAFSRARKLSELLPTLGSDAIPAVKSQLLRSRAALSGAEFELLVRFWASKDPREATAWAFQLVAPTYRALAVQTAVEEWAAIDGPAALAGIGKAIQSDTEVNTIWVSRVALMRGWFRSDRAGLEAHVRGLGVTPEREDWVLGYILVLGQAQGADAVMQWAEARPEDDEPLKRSAYHHVTAFFNNFDPQAAQRWCDKQCDGPYAVGMRAVVVLGRLQSGEDVKPIVEWVSQAPRSAENDQTLITAFATWGRRDRDAAFAWMREKLANGSEPWLSLLKVPYARQLAETAPAEAIEVAKSAEPESAREALLIEIARRWRSQDAAAADAWLASSPLSAEARESARSAPPPAPASASAPEEKGAAPL
jgi:hypothetical protein